MKHSTLFTFKKVLNTADGEPVAVFDFNAQNCSPMVPEWAVHLRAHYCLEAEIDNLRAGTGKTREEFLREMMFPSAPHVMSAEFAEILVADYIEFCMGYKVPRVRYLYKINPNLPVNGVDIVAFNKSMTDPKLDELMLCEVKAALVGVNLNTLQSAIDDAGGKDPLRMCDTLNAFKRRLQLAGNVAGAQEIERFQNRTERPYMYISAAAAVHSDATWDESIVSDALCNGFPNCKFRLLAIKGPDLMTLARDLYEAACA